MAGRIPQAFIDELLSRTDLVELIGARVQLKRSGRNHTGLCPFHNEKSPSFSVNAERQFYHCFGCKASGNAISFLMDHDHLDFVEAVEHLAGLHGLDVPREGVAASHSSQEERERLKALTATRHRCMRLAQTYFSDLLSRPEGQAGAAYLQRRGLNEAMIQHYGLGVAPDAWDGLKNYLLQQDIPEALQLELGLLASKEETGRTYDRFRHRVIFPIRDTKGEVIGFGGRVLDDSKPKYLNSPETPLFHKSEALYGLYEARQQAGRLERLLIVEGYMDVVALTQQGVSGAVATLGTATTPEHLRRVFRLVNEVVFCFDGDAAGAQASIKALEALLPLMEEGRHARFLFLPQGEDPDSLVRKEGLGPFEQRISQATPLAEYLLSLWQQGLNLQRLDDQAQLAQTARTWLALLPNGLLKRRLLVTLSQKTGLPESDLLGIASSPQAASGVTNVTPEAVSVKPAAKAPGQVTSLTERLFRLLVRYPDLAANVPLDLPWCNEDPALGEVFLPVLKQLHQVPATSTQVLLSFWTGTPQGEALLQRARLVLELNHEAAAQEVLAICAKLQAQQSEKVWEQTRQSLISKSERGELSTEERQQLWAMIRDKHQAKKH